MQVRKQQIVEFFMRRDDIDRAQQADETLPDPVDLDGDDAEAVRSLGLDPGLLATQIANLEE